MNSKPESRLFLTIASGEFYQRMAAVTHPFLKKYAKKIGADFQCIENPHKSLPAHFQKMAIRELFDDYDRILFMDTDILVRPDCPDLFELVDESHLGILDQAPHYPTSPVQFSETISQWGYDLTPERYFNTGVMVISKCHRDLYRIPENIRIEQIPFDQEQTVLNLNFLLDRTKIKELDLTFNHLATSEIEPDYADSFVIHYAGYKSGFREELLETIKEDALALAKRFDQSLV